MATSPTRPAAGEALAALYLYTHDVARQLKPSADGELAHALHETLHFALDAQEQDWSQRLFDRQQQQQQPDCGGQSGHQQQTRVDALKQQLVITPRLADSQPSSSTASPLRTPTTLPGPIPDLPQDLPPARAGFFPNPFWIPPSSRNPSPPPAAAASQGQQQQQARSHSRSGTTSPTRSGAGGGPRKSRTPPYISYGWQARTHTLSLPHPATISNPTKLDPCSPENRSAFDVTAKIFFLDDILPSARGQRGENDEQQDLDAKAREALVQQQADKLAGYVENAVKRLSGSTGIITLDTLLLSFPQAGFEASFVGSQGGRSEHELTRARDERLQVVAELWRNLSMSPQLLSLGLSRFSLSSLQSLFRLLNGMPQPPGGPPPTTPSLASALVRSFSQAGSTTESNSMNQDAARWPDAYSTPREVRRPRLVTAVLNSSSANGGSVAGGSTGSAQGATPAVAMAIPSAGATGASSSSSASSLSEADGHRPNGAAAGDESKALTQWCEQEGIVPVADTDRKDVLPRRTLPTLLKEFRDALPHPVPEGHRLAPRWVMKYSVLIRDRGIIADRGYILYAEVEPEEAQD
ncbi:hypothetical protein OC834_004969 [Tilletia horrida]|nr:hypothetical protein OC834_004969 [Tilletia horrida]